MTLNEKYIITHLYSKVTMLPGSWNKRFIRNLYYSAISENEIELTEKQQEWIYRLTYTYRKQIPQVY